MKRVHIHLRVKALDESREFYSALFGQMPTKVKDDYLQWRMDTPALNFAISEGSEKFGVDHLGIEFSSSDALKKIKENASLSALNGVSSEASCCYAKSEKHWLIDPQSMAWEYFHTLSDADSAGIEHGIGGQEDSACCIPLRDQSLNCCIKDNQNDEGSSCCA